MRTVSRSILLVLSLAAVCGCGGKKNPVSSGGNNTQGTITLSSALTGTYNDVIFKGTYLTSANTGAVSALVADPLFVTVDILFSGDLHTGTFKNTDPGAKGTVTIVSGNATWAANAQTGKGSYTLDLTDAGTAFTDSTGKSYSNIHGTLAAEAPAVAGTSAAGSVTVTANF